MQLLNKDTFINPLKDAHLKNKATFSAGYCQILLITLSY